MAFHVDSLYQWCSQACSVVTSKIDEILAIEPPAPPAVEDLNTVNVGQEDTNNHVDDTEHEDLNRAVASDHEDLDDSTVVSDHSSMSISDSAVTESDGGVPVNKSKETFTMTDIKALDEAPSTPTSTSSTTAVQDTPEREPLVTGEGGPAAIKGDSVIADESDNQGDSEDDTDESWISIPNSVKKVMVKVKISGTRKYWMINKDLLCSKSTYFKTALNGAWMEARTNEVELEERVDLFQIFYYWLEQGHLNFMESGQWVESSEEYLKACVRIYSFADFYGVPGLGDLVIHKFDKRIRPGGLPGRLDVSIINLAWELLHETSGLCRCILAIERDANRCNIPKRPGVEYEGLPGNFIAALLQTTEDDSDYWLTSTVRKQPVDMAILHNHVKSNGGLTNVGLRKWDKICAMMGIILPEGYTQDRLRGHIRGMYRRWLRPWDITLSPTQLKVAVEECPRPVAKDFFHNAVPVKKLRLRPAPRY